MSTQLPLGLCCLAEMAPALTEAATQARVKLSTPGTAGPGGTLHGLPVLNGRGSPTLDSKTGVQQLGHQKPPLALQVVTFSKDLQSKHQGPAGKLHLQGQGPAGKILHIPDKGPSGDIPKVVFQQPVARTLVANIVSNSQQKGINTVTIKPASVKGMNLQKLTPEQNHTGQAKMPRGGGFPLATVSNNKTSIVGITSKIDPQSVVPSTSTGPTVQIPAEMLIPNTGLSQSSGGETGEEQIQVQEVGNSLTIQSSNSPNYSAGMAEVGLLSNVDLVEEAAKKQREMERRSERLLRRLRRLQGRQAVSHMQTQLTGLVDHQHQNLQSMAKSIKGQPSNLDLKAELLHSEDAKSLSTAALVDLVVKLQSTQQSMSLRQRLANPSASTSGEGSSSILKLDEDLCVEMNRVSSTLQTNLHHLESAIDSDATESSSGGESCDEDYDLDDEKLPRPKLQRRAEWKWPMERAAVAARWTWLQAQVSDLEYRIRQQTDIYRQIRAGKGAVVLGDVQPPPDLSQVKTPRTGRKLSPLEEKIANLERKNTEMSPCNLSTLLSNVDKQSSRLTQQLGNVYSPQSSPLVANTLRTVAASTSKTPSTPNGFVDGVGAHSSSHVGNTCSTPDNQSDSTNPNLQKLKTEGAQPIHFDPPSPVVDNTCVAARCRPVRSYGKRKLLRTAGIQYLGNRKAARLSTVKCRCCPPTVPCAMCGGRFNNLAPLQPDTMPVSERVALLDHSYHQVLSFPQDTPLTVHFESLLKSGEWQHKPPPKPVKIPHTTERKRKMSDKPRRPYTRRLNKSSTAAMLSSKIRNKYDQKPLSRSHSGSFSEDVYLSRSEMRKRKGSSSSDFMEKRSRGDGDSYLNSSGSSQSLKELKESLRRRRGESAFDINNIVIPYSMAASTRVEKLQYKEILTPKWRELPNEMSPTSDVSVMSTEPTPTLATAAGEPTVLTPEISDSDKSNSTHSVPKDDNTTNNKVLKENGVEETKKDTENKETTSSPGFKEVEENVMHLAPGETVVSSTPVMNDMILIKTSLGHEWEIEDLSDQLLTERHLRCEVAEKKRYMSVTKKRNRGSRSESKAEPATPDPDSALAAIQTPPNTPASTSKLTGLEDTDEMRKRSGSCSSRTEETLSREPRRRVGSVSRSRSKSVSEDRYRTEHPHVESWTLRTFPLSDKDMEIIEKEKETGVSQGYNRICSTGRRSRMSATMRDMYTPTPGDSNPCSPLSSTSGEMLEDDLDDPEWTVENDPNDPEWTVVEGAERRKNKAPTIVLKLAKR